MFSSIRVRLTLWYLLVFGSLLVAFSLYLYSLVSNDMHRRFDWSLQRTSQSMANYFCEFGDRSNVEEEARETISSLKEGRESAAIFREGQLLAANNDDVVAAVTSTGILDVSGPDRKPAFATERADHGNVSGGGEPVQSGIAAVSREGRVYRRAEEAGVGNRPGSGDGAEVPRELSV